MKKITVFALLMVSGFVYSQFSTGTVTLTGLNGTAGTVKIDTDATIVTMTLTGVSTVWLGIGFGGSGSMGGVTDFFIWNSTANRDYTSTGGFFAPSAEAVASQSWTIVSDNVVGTNRTVVATRPLVSAGDFTFLNSNSSIQIIFAQGTATNLAYHGGNPHNGLLLTRSSLANEDFSLNATAVYPNPANGEFKVQTKTNLDQINIYSQTGQFVKTIEVSDKSNKVEVNVKDLSAGIYLIELKNSNEKSWKKVIVE